MANDEQRVLLIGGPKHGEFIDLPEDATEYDFTSMKTLMPADEQPSWSFWPDSATHLYRFDSELTSRFGARLNVFTHEVLWGSPYHGGFNLLSLREALRTIEKAKADAETARDTQITTSNRNRELERECNDWQNKYEKLLEIANNLDQQLQGVRQALEIAATGVGSAISATGKAYNAFGPIQNLTGSGDA